MTQRAPRTILSRAVELWQRIRGWRRIRFTRGGLVFTMGAFAVGFAAINTGNNLLYLLLGAMLGFIAVSGWLSEQMIRRLRVRRKTPRGVTVGNPVRIEYTILNRKERLPTFALEISEKGLPGKAFLPSLPAGETLIIRSENRFVRRGVYPLGTLTLSTAFPFGLFHKERDLSLGGELVIWPRSDRKIHRPSTSGGDVLRLGRAAVGVAGPRGEYRGLRPFRPGDDPKDIHWRSTARLGEPIIREYERSDSDALWICLDLRGEPGDRAEEAVEIAASLAARAIQEGRRVGLSTWKVSLDQGHGPGQMERILNALARVDFRPGSPRVVSPANPARCVLVGLRGDVVAGYGDALIVGRTGP